MTMQELADRLSTEDLGYIIQYCVSARNIDDPVLAPLWEQARTLLNTIEAYIEDNTVDPGRLDDFLELMEMDDAPGGFV